MRNSTKTELRTLREVAHFLLPLVCCEFCGKPLLDPKLADKVFGDKAHTPLKFLKLTTHHRNGKHRDNTRHKTLDILPDTMDAHKAVSDLTLENIMFAICGNTSLTHRPCHGEHEMKLNHHKRKVMKVKPLHQRVKAILKKILSVDIEKLDETFTASEMKFLHIADNNKKCTRYELRRLKKLAAKVEKKK